MEEDVEEEDGGYGWERKKKHNNNITFRIHNIIGVYVVVIDYEGVPNTNYKLTLSDHQ